MDISLMNELIKYILPSIITFLVVYYFMDKRSQTNSNPSTTPKDQTNVLLPLKIQALERMVLFLERISLNNVVPRLNDSSLTAKEFQYVLCNEINQEFEHNMSQQLYIPSNTWNMIVLAKDQTIQQIIQSSQTLAADAKARDLAIAILNQTISDKDMTPSAQAIELVKAEFQKLSS